MTLARGRQPYVLLALCYVVSRAMFIAFGVRFLSAETIAGAIQLPDPSLLQQHFFHTLWTLHIQPPLFSALVGSALLLFGEAAQSVLHLLFLLCGLALNLVLLRCLLLCAVPPRVALVVALIYCVAPSQVMYEHWLFYTHLTAFLLLLSLWCLLEGVASRRTVWAHRLAWCFAALCLLRSSFHLALFALPCAMVWCYAGKRIALRAFALPVLLVFLLYAKNLAMFGFFGGSSFAGMNLANIAVSQLAPEQKQQLADVTRSPLIVHKPFRGNAGCATPAGGGDDYCKTTGYRNFNTDEVLALSREYGALAKQSIAMFPQSYTRSVMMGMVLATAPSERFFYTVENLLPVIAYADWYDLLVWAAPYKIFTPNWSAENGEFPFMPGLTVLFLFPVSLMLWWLRALQGRAWQQPQPRFYALCYATAIIGYCLLVSSLFEYGENNRFRYDWEALMVLILTAAWVRRA